MKKPHKHCELIKAWAEGAEIEVYSNIEKKWVGLTSPSWAGDIEYRIKPEPKPDVVRFTFMHLHANVRPLCNEMIVGDNLKLTFDGETGKLKSAEVI